MEKDSKLNSPNVTPLRKPVKCPNCKKMSARETYPFCSKRCADVDLNRWFSGSYTIPQKQGDSENAEMLDDLD